MEFWEAVILGIVQGLTEFLPVSSTGHLEITKAVLNIDLGECDIFFDIMLHAGTLVAVFIVYWKKIWRLFTKPYKKLLYLIIATVPAGLAGVLLDDLLEEYCLNGFVCGICFLITAGLLLACEYAAEKNKKSGRLSDLNLKNTFSMGIAQAFAVFPGISRSGSTIAAGVFAGGKSEEVADFTFLMSIPVILGSLVLKLLGLFVHEGEFQAAVGAFSSTGNMIGCLVFGIISAAAVGLFAIKLVLSAVKKANYKWFSVYLAVVAVASFVLYANGRFI